MTNQNYNHAKAIINKLTLDELIFKLGGFDTKRLGYGDEKSVYIKGRRIGAITDAEYPTDEEIAERLFGDYTAFDFACEFLEDAEFAQLVYDLMSEEERAEICDHTDDDAIKLYGEEVF